MFHVSQKAFRTPDGLSLSFLKDSTYLQAGRSNPSGLEDVNAMVLLYKSDYFALTTTFLSVGPGELEECNTRAFFLKLLSFMSVETELQDQIACLTVTLFVVPQNFTQ